MGPWFFMSYARRDDDVEERGGDVRSFFEDLRKAVSDLVPHEESGYLDQHALDAGDHWPSELAIALRTCRTFVPILTPRYFHREFCGKEWNVFEERLKALAGPGQRPPPLIVPVVWLLPLEDDEFPSWAMEMHATISREDVTEGERELVAHYDRYGLQWVHKRRQSTHGGAYDTIVRSLAKRIIRVGREHELPPKTEIADLRQVPNRFERPQRPGPGALGEAADPALRASFVIVAPLRHELPPEMAALQERYADDWGDWRPYHPDVADSVGLIAQKQASSENLRVEWIAPNGALFEQLRLAEARKSAAIMILDPRSVSIATYRQLLEQFDTVLFGNLVILVPWELEGRLSGDEERELKDTLADVLWRWSTRHGIRDSVRGARELEREIRRALQDIQAILASHRRPLRETPQGGPPGLPSVSPAAPAGVPV